MKTRARWLSEWDWSWYMGNLARRWEFTKVGDKGRSDSEHWKHV